MTNAALRGKPDAGNPHVRFDEGEVAPAATPRRGSLLYKKMATVFFLSSALLVKTAVAASVGTGSLSVSFDTTDAGRGSVGHIVARATGLDFVAPKAQPLWRIECRRTNDFTVIATADARQAKTFSCEAIDGGVRLVYRDIGPALEEVVCRVTADSGDGMVRWRIASTPKPGWATYDTAYPIIALSEALGGDPTDDCTTAGTMKGGVNRYPMDPKREYWKARLHGEFPGSLSSPFGAFYDPKLGGLYTAAEDDQGYAKSLLVDRWWRAQLPDGTFREGDLLLRWNHFECSEITRETSYDIVMRAFSGKDGEPCEWRDAADIYREWAKNRRWCQTKLADRRDVPDWAKNGPFQMKFNRAWFRHPGLVQRWIDTYKTKRFPSVPFVAMVEGWEKHGDWVTPDYFPCYPSDAAFTKMCNDLRSADGHVWAWPGGHHWNVRVGKRPDGAYNLDYTDLFTREVKAHCCLQPDGTPWLDALSWLGGGESASLCPATAYGRAWWTDYVACGLVRRGAGLVQADQECGAMIRECWSREHGHAPGRGKWTTGMMRRQYEEQLAAMRRIDPWAQFSFEECAEFYNDILCFHDYRNCRFGGAEWASVQNYLNHEHVTPYQPGSEFYSHWDWVAHSAADGQMPRLPEHPDAYFPMPAVSNGGFEEPQLGLVGFVGWYGTTCGAEVVTNDCVEGVLSAGIFAASAKTNVSVGRNISASILPGRACKVTLAMKTLVPGKGGLFVYGVGGGGKLREFVAPPDAAEGWVRREVFFALADDAQAVRLEFRASDGARFLTDDVRLFAKSADGAYVEVTQRAQEEQRAFAERWIDIYHANAKWLQHGRHLRPPKLDCEMRTVEETFRGRKGTFVRPSVFTGAFRASDGTEGIFYVNATDREQAFTARWRGETFARTLGPRELTFEEVKKPGDGKVECVAVYYPHWHAYPKGTEWFGEKWNEGEWTFVKDAKVRFDGQKQPLVPYAGYLNEADPKDMAKDIALAANAGIDVFLYDYYYYDGQVTQEAALEKGFLGAENRDRMKFALMWCYHERVDAFRPELGKPRRRLMSLAHTKEEFLGLIDLAITRYFPRPEYWRHNGKLFFSIYNSADFLEKRGGDPARVKAELDEARAKVRAAGLGEIEFNAQNASPALVPKMKACGFDSLTDYGNNVSRMPGKELYEMRQKGVWEVPYADCVPHVYRRWAEMAETELPYYPNVTTGWDSTPRCRAEEPYPWQKNDYPYSMSFRDNDADTFRRMLAAAKEHVLRDPKRPGVVYVNGWNEYTEGTYLVPNNFDSDLFLRAVTSVFGRHPADEYTYVNPSTKQLFTIPAATHENVAYGPHPKQKIDVFLPKAAKGPFPIVVYIHGGGWSGGAMEDHILGSSIRMLLDRGIAVVGTGYRYLSECQRDGVKPPVLGCLEDCERAVKFVRSKAGEWNLDLVRVALAGGSAGACTALHLALKDGNALGVAAVAPIIPQTSMDPAEMREWIPDMKYGAHAFGYRSFDDWLAHRADCLDIVERVSPAALLRKIDAPHAPRIVMQGMQMPATGERVKDATHSPVFMVKFKEIADAKGVPCEIVTGREPCFGAAFVRLAEILTEKPVGNR